MELLLIKRLHTAEDHQNILVIPENNFACYLSHWAVPSEFGWTCDPSFISYSIGNKNIGSDKLWDTWFYNKSERLLSQDFPTLRLKVR